MLFMMIRANGTVVGFRTVELRDGGIHERESLQTFRQLRGDLGMTREQLAAVRTLAGVDGGHVLLHRRDHTRVVDANAGARRGGGQVVAPVGGAIGARRRRIVRAHCDAPISPFSFASARTHSFCTLSSLLPIRSATC